MPISKIEELDDFLKYIFFKGNGKRRTINETVFIVIRLICRNEKNGEGGRRFTLAKKVWNSNYNGNFILKDIQNSEDINNENLGDYLRKVSNFIKEIYNALKDSKNKTLQKIKHFKQHKVTTEGFLKYLGAYRDRKENKDDFLTSVSTDSVTEKDKYRINLKRVANKITKILDVIESDKAFTFDNAAKKQKEFNSLYRQIEPLIKNGKNSKLKQKFEEVTNKLKELWDATINNESEKLEEIKNNTTALQNFSNLILEEAKLLKNSPTKNSLDSLLDKTSSYEIFQWEESIKSAYYDNDFMYNGSWGSNVLNSLKRCAEKCKKYGSFEEYKRQRNDIMKMFELVKNKP